MGSPVFGSIRTHGPAAPLLPASHFRLALSSRRLNTSNFCSRGVNFRFRLGFRSARSMIDQANSFNFDLSILLPFLSVSETEFRFRICQNTRFSHFVSF
jgi:hypothetical protein